jgi:hypothetical protein
MIQHVFGAFEHVADQHSSSHPMCRTAVSESVRTGGGWAISVIGGAVFKMHRHAPAQRKRAAPGADAPPLVVLDVLVLMVRALCAPAVRMHAALPAGACARAGQVAQDEGKCGQGYGTRLVNGLKVPT